MQGHPWGIACTFFFFSIKHAKKKIFELAARFFFFFSLCLLFICHCTGGLFTLLKRMRDPRDTALHAKFLSKGLEKEKGRSFQAFWNRGGLLLLLLCPMYVGPDAATALQVYLDPGLRRWVLLLRADQANISTGSVWGGLRCPKSWYWNSELLYHCRAPHSAHGISPGRLLSNWRWCFSFPAPPCWLFWMKSGMNSWMCH